MKKEEKIKVEGTVTKALPGTSFLVELKDGGVVTAHLCGKMKLHYIKIIPGDRVIVEISPYDPTRGRIIRRL
ncbi:MAG: translation initiation factor IF-1 [Candidatus Omnitrophota bacterium]|nr:MAG: translation initiation factor IF-1 [Candidatus Omnitrophota bacterium]